MSIHTISDAVSGIEDLNGSTPRDRLVLADIGSQVGHHFSKYCVDDLAEVFETLMNAAILAGFERNEAWRILDKSLLSGYCEGTADRWNGKL